MPASRPTPLALALAAGILCASPAFAQEPEPEPTPEPAPATPEPPPATEDAAVPAEVPEAKPPPDLAPSDQAAEGEVPPEAVTPPPEAMLDGQLRLGAFLSGPGSMTFLLHHSILGAVAGLTTQGIGRNFSLELGNREAMLAGTLVGAGVGFGVAAWWQFNHWVDHPMATYGIVNSVASGLFFTGLVNVFTNWPDNKVALAWTGFLGAELGAWLTASLGGGQMPLNHGLMTASGAGWGLIYGALLMGAINSSSDLNGKQVFNTLSIATGIGAGALALATTRYDPTPLQILRADLFGAGVGGAVFLISALVLGLNFQQATPYVLAMVTSAGAIAAVTLLWEEAAERKPPALSNARYLYRSKEKDRPYSNIWW